MRVFFAVLFLSCVPFSVQARTVLLGGDSIGMTLVHRQLLVTDFYEVEGQRSPLQRAGGQKGDWLLKVNGQRIMNIVQLQRQLQQLNKVALVIKRDGRIMQLHVPLVKRRLGVYVKQEMNGIGTLTFVDPRSRQFIALGHHVIEPETNQSFAPARGKLFAVHVAGIERSVNGVTGMKKGGAFHHHVGSITRNDKYGIIGRWEGRLPKREIPLAQASDIRVGSAQLLTVLDGQRTQSFTIRIMKHEKETNRFRFQVTDHRLLQRAGGIVQGMSGSPIIQNGKLVGAVTHVVVSQPQFGYGVYAEWLAQRCCR